MLRVSEPRQERWRKPEAKEKHKAVRESRETVTNEKQKASVPKEMLAASDTMIPHVKKGKTEREATRSPLLHGTL